MQKLEFVMALGALSAHSMDDLCMHSMKVSLTQKHISEL